MPYRWTRKEPCLRIIIVGGFSQSLLNFRGPLIRDIVSRGHEVIACAPHAPEEVRAELAAIGARYRHVPIARAGRNPASDLHTLLSLVRVLRKERPDLLLTYTIKPVIYGSLAARLPPRPVSFAMITGAGYAFGEGGGHRRAVGRVVRGLYRLTLSRNRVVFFQNPDDLKLFEERKMIGPNTKTVVLNGSGVDLEHYVQEKLPNRPVFLLMARLIADKGIREYREAARRIRIEYPNARFLLAGAIDENPTSIHRDELAQWEAEGDIEYLGGLADVRPALREALVYVLPSYYREGTPRSVLEAMSMGRPIITTDSPGCRETVEDGVTGYLVPVKDPVALIAVMRAFVENPELAVRMGRESRRLAEEKYDVHRVNGMILDAMAL